MKKNENENNKKPQFKSSLLTKDAIYEMVYTPANNKTSYCGITKSGQTRSFIETIEIDGIVCEPFPPDHALVEKEIVLFPSMATPYTSDEEILKEIQDFIHKYLDISPVFEHIATYYVLFTWIYDKFNEVPYLRAIGDYGSGKSRFIQTIGSLCYKPIFTGGATTPSPIFRLINEIKGTLVLDEADFRFSDKTSEIIKILNMGYQKGGSVIRMAGKDFDEYKICDVYSPKIVATRMTFSDKALESRFLIEEMGVGSLRKDIPRTLDASFYSDATRIRNKLLMWRLKNYFRPIELCEENIENIHPRLNQIAIPLLSIIKDDATRKELREFLIKYNDELVADRGLSWESDILFAILKLEHELKKSEITVKEITDEVNREIDINDDVLKARKVGWYLRTRLLLKPYKTRKGFVLNLEQNRRRLNMWKERFGITESDITGEHVNVVNVSEDK